MGASSNYTSKLKYNIDDLVSSLARCKTQAAQVDDILSNIGDRGSLNEFIKQFVAMDDAIQKLSRDVSTVKSELGDSLKGGFSSSLDDMIKKMAELSKISQSVFLGIANIDLKDKGAAKQLTDFAGQLNSLFKNIGIDKPIDLEVFNAKSVTDQFDMVVNAAKQLNGKLQVVLGDIDFSGIGKGHGGGFGGAIKDAASQLTELKKELVQAYKDYYQEVVDSSFDADEMDPSEKMDEIQDKVNGMLDKLKLDKDTRFALDNIIVDLQIGDLDVEDISSEVDKLFKGISSDALILEEVEAGFGGVGSSADDATLKVNNLKEKLDEIVRHSGKHNLEFSAVLTDDGASIRKGLNDVSTDVAQNLGNMLSSLDKYFVDAHTHTRTSLVTNDEDLAYWAKLKKYGVTNHNAILGPNGATSFDFSAVSDADMEKVIQRVKELSSSGNVTVEKLKEIFTTIDAGYSGVVQHFDAHQMDEFAQYILNVADNADKTITPLERFKNLVRFFANNSNYDFSQWAKDLENFSPDKAAELFNKMGVRDGVVVDGSRKTMADVLGDLPAGGAQDEQERLALLEREKELLEQIADLEAKLETLSQNTTDVEKLNEAQNEIQGLKQSLQELREENDRLKGDNYYLDSHYSQRLEEAEANIKQLTDALTDLEQKNAELSSQLANDGEELDDIQKENGALEDRLEILRDIAEQYGVNITQKERNRYEELTDKDNEDGLTSSEQERFDELSETIEEADSNLLEFEETYERIILKLSNGKKLEILPNDKGLRDLYKINDEYGTYNGHEIEEVKFIRQEISSYEELIELVERYNQLRQKGQSKKLTDKENQEFKYIADRISKSASGKHLSDALTSDGYNLDRLAEMLGFKIPEAASKAEQAINGAFSRTEEEYSEAQAEIQSLNQSLQDLRDENLQMQGANDHLRSSYDALGARLFEEELKVEQLTESLQDLEQQNKDLVDSSAYHESASGQMSLLPIVEQEIAAKEELVEQNKELVASQQQLDGQIGLFDQQEIQQEETAVDNLNVAFGEEHKTALEQAIAAEKAKEDQSKLLTEQLQQELEVVNALNEALANHAGLSGGEDSSTPPAAPVPVKYSDAELTNIAFNSLGDAADKAVLSIDQTSDGLNTVTGVLKNANDEWQSYNIVIDKNGDIIDKHVGHNQKIIKAYLQRGKAAEDVAKAEAKANKSKELNEIDKLAAKATDRFKKATGGVNANALSGKASEAYKKYNDVYAELLRQQKAFNNDPRSATKDSVAEFEELSKAVGKAAKEFEDLKVASDKLQNTKGFEGFSDQLDADVINNADLLKQKMREYAEETSNGVVSNISFTNSGKTMNYEVDRGKGIIDKMILSLDEYSGRLGKVNKKQSETATGMSKLSKIMSDGWTNVMRYVGSFGSFYEVLAQVRKGIGYVREIDQALTELKKVTDETDATYQKFLNNMSKTASVVGSTVADLTTMAAEWARLGYDLADSAKLAESTAILLNVSEFQDATKASEALISTMQAFQYTADESQHVVDILNEVGNNYAVSSDGIATALQDSASALMEGGNNLEQAVALVAAAMKIGCSYRNI